jgi:putative hydrolase of the HAD superfamily
MTDAKALLVDLDDTLVAFDAVTESSWRQVCAEYRAAHPSVDADSLMTRIKAASDEYWRDPERHRAGRADILNTRRMFVSRAFAALGLPAPDAVRLADRYSTVRIDAMYLLPGVHEALARIRARGCALVLVTNGDGAGQRSKIERFDLARFFDHILVEGELGVGKPDPGIYKEALRLLGLPPEQACMVGDNIVWDVDAPQRLGIRAIWIDRVGLGCSPDARVTPERIARSFAEVPRMLFEG